MSKLCRNFQAFIEITSLRMETEVSGLGPHLIMYSCELSFKVCRGLFRGFIGHVMQFCRGTSRS